MNTDDNHSDKQRPAKDEAGGNRLATIGQLVIAATAVTTVILSYNSSAAAARAAHDTAISAKRSQELFQGSAACRAIRTEIRELHQAGLSRRKITMVLSTEKTTSFFHVQGKRSPNALDEDNKNCGTRNGDNGTVQQWIKIISSVPSPADGH